jgi:hypothetical protein
VGGGEVQGAAADWQVRLRLGRSVALHCRSFALSQFR